MSNAVFLRHPVGVRITTETVITEEDFAYDADGRERPRTDHPHPHRQHRIRGDRPMTDNGSGPAP